MWEQEIQLFLISGPLIVSCTVRYQKEVQEDAPMFDLFCVIFTAESQ